MGLLSDFYSFGDGLKRRLRGLLADPSGTLDQLNAQARNFNAGVNPVVANGLLFNRPITDAERTQRAMDLAMSFAPVGMFIGKGAKTWDAVMASKAMDMEKAGVDPRAIWKETGNWKGPDGHWRQEISDKYDLVDTPNGAEEIGAMWKNGPNQHFGALGKDLSPSITQHMAMSHSDLFGAYPELKAYQLTGGAAPNSGSLGGKSIKLSWGDIARAQKPQKVEDISKPMSINLHELQHAIQQREGWARGGSPDGPLTQETRRLLIDDILQWARPIDEANGVPFIDTWNRASKSIDSPRMRGEIYNRLAGEAEARATQARMSMDAAQRRATFPADSYDVPLNQLIMNGQFLK